MRRGMPLTRFGKSSGERDDFSQIQNGKCYTSTRDLRSVVGERDAI